MHNSKRMNGSYRKNVALVNLSLLQNIEEKDVKAIFLMLILNKKTTSCVLCFVSFFAKKTSESFFSRNFRLVPVTESAVEPTHQTQKGDLKKRLK